MIHLKKKFKKVPYFREFQPVKFFIQFVDFEKKMLDQYPASSLIFFQSHCIFVAYSCPIGCLHSLIENVYNA